MKLLKSKIFSRQRSSGLRSVIALILFTSLKCYLRSASLHFGYKCSARIWVAHFWVAYLGGIFGWHIWMHIWVHLFGAYLGACLGAYLTFPTAYFSGVFERLILVAFSAGVFLWQNLWHTLRHISKNLTFTIRLKKRARRLSACKNKICQPKFRLRYAARKQASPKRLKRDVATSS